MKQKKRKNWLLGLLPHLLFTSTIGVQHVLSQGNKWRRTQHCKHLHFLHNYSLCHSPTDNWVHLVHPRLLSNNHQYVRNTHWIGLTFNFHYRTPEVELLNPLSGLTSSPHSVSVTTFPDMSIMLRVLLDTSRFDLVVSRVTSSTVLHTPITSAKKKQWWDQDQLIVFPTVNSIQHQLDLRSKGQSTCNWWFYPWVAVAAFISTETSLSIST